MKIVALAPFPFVEMNFGGAERIYNLLTRIDDSVQVFVPNLTGNGTQKHKNLDIKILKLPDRVQGIEYDIAVAEGSKETFGHLIEDADLVILEHPWQVEALSGQKFLYDAHNNEAKLKEVISTPEIVKRATELEQQALKANYVTYCSVDDDILTDSPKTYIPNGTNLPKIINRRGFGSKVLLFVGSAHPPNIGAALTLANLSQVLLDYEIVIAGNCAKYIQTDAPNVHLMGQVTPEVLDYLMRTSFAFVNLMAAGSGTSLKVIKSLSYGLPVISSPIGARGYAEGCITAKTAQQVIENLERLKSPAEWEMVSEASTGLARGYSWDVIGAKFNEVIEGLL